MRHKFFRVGDDWWRIQYAAMGTPGDAPEDLGECDYDARTITINRDIMDAPNRIEVIIHEAIHAAQPDLKEEAVQRTGLAITNALQVMGIL